VAQGARLNYGARSPRIASICHRSGNARTREGQPTLLNIEGIVNAWISRLSCYRFKILSVPERLQPRHEWLAATSSVTAEVSSSMAATYRPTAQDLPEWNAVISLILHQRVPHPPFFPGAFGGIPHLFRYISPAMRGSCKTWWTAAEYSCRRGNGGDITPIAYRQESSSVQLL
jgi:hypothetical protein